MKYFSFAEPTGYGLSAVSYLNGLADAGADVSWLPMTWQQDHGAYGYQPREPGGWRTLLGKLSASDAAIRKVGCAENEKGAVLMHTVPEYWPHLVEDRSLNVGYTVWETSRIPGHWRVLLATADRILVPSRHAKRVIEEARCNRPIYVVPHLPSPGTDIPAATTADAHTHTKSDCFTFYSINLWQPRKGLELLVEAYLKAFHAGDPVVLYIKTGPVGFDLSRGEKAETAMLIEKYKRGVKRPARIVLDTAWRPNPDIANLHRSGHCYVSLTRCEGWGMGAFDAAWIGTPIIMTGYGGQTDYLDPQLCRLVDYRMVGVEYHSEFPSYTEDQAWAEPCVEHAVSAMRETFENYSEARERAAVLSKQVRRVFAAREVLGELRTAVSR